MKRIITAVAVLGIVSGALAFKGKTFDVATVYCTTPDLDQCIDPPFPSHNLVPFQESSIGPITNPCTGVLLPYVKVSGFFCVKSQAPFFVQVRL